MAISNETKVGFLVIAALAGLAWLSVKSGSFGTSLATPMRDFTTSFNDVDGISKGSPVKMSGVPVGEVQSIQLQPNGTAVVKMQVRKDLTLPADVSAQVDSSGLIGEKFVSLVPGPQSRIVSGTDMPILLPPTVTQLPSTNTSAGGNPADKFGKVADDLQSMTGNLRSVLGDPDNAAKLQTIIDGLSTLSANMEGNSGEIIANIREASASLKEVLAKANDPSSTIGQLLATNGTSGSNPMGDMQQAMRNLNEITTKINSGQGTIGQLVNDPKTAEKLNGALDSLSSITKKIDQFKTDIDFQAYSLLTQKGAGKGAATITLQPNDHRYYVLGVTSDGLASYSGDADRIGTKYYGQDFGRTTKFTAQIGQIYKGMFFGQDLGMRIGLKDSSGGIGFDTRMPGVQPLRLTADLYDFGGSHTPDSTKVHVDLKARYDIGSTGFYGMAGYDNVLSKRYGSPIIGAGYHFVDDDLKYLVGRAL